MKKTEKIKFLTDTREMCFDSCLDERNNQFSEETVWECVISNQIGKNKEEEWFEGLNQSFKNKKCSSKIWLNEQLENLYVYPFSDSKTKSFKGDCHEFVSYILNKEYSHLEYMNLKKTEDFLKNTQKKTPKMGDWVIYYKDNKDNKDNFITSKHSGICLGAFPKDKENDVIYYVLSKFGQGTNDIFVHEINSVVPLYEGEISYVEHTLNNDTKKYLQNIADELSQKIDLKYLKSTKLLPFNQAIKDKKFELALRWAASECEVQLAKQLLEYLSKYNIKFDINDKSLTSKETAVDFALKSKKNEEQRINMCNFLIDEYKAKPSDEKNEKYRAYLLKKEVIDKKHKNINII